MHPHKFVVHKLKELKATPKGAIHVGGHWGEESRQYDEFGLTRQLWIEPIKQNFDQMVRTLPKRPEVRAFQVACSNSEGRQTMVISKDWKAETHSLANLKRQTEIHPEHAQVASCEVDVVRLDDLMSRENIDPHDYNVMVVDTQGMELDTLKGSEKAVACMDYIMAEVGTIELYEGMALDHEVDAWLSSRGFSKVDTNWFGPKVNGKSTYGDSFYVRKGL